MSAYPRWIIEGYAKLISPKIRTRVLARYGWVYVGIRQFADGSEKPIYRHAAP